jgi:hypothetical protein
LQQFLKREIFDLKQKLPAHKNEALTEVKKEFFCESSNSAPPGVLSFL